MISKKELSNAKVCYDFENVLEAANILKETKARHLIVINEENAPIGIISSVDIVNRVIAEELDPEKTKVKKVMTKNIDIIDINDTYENAYHQMAELGTYSIPVVDEDKKLCGLLDLMVAFRHKDD
jgi:CBS domain-containing protein